MTTLDGLDRLKAQLLSSGIQQENFALFQVINQLIQFLRDQVTQTNVAIGGSGGGSPGLSGVTYLTKTNETATLPNSRMELAGAGIEFNDSPGYRRIISTALPFILDGQDGIDGEIGLQGPIGPRGLIGGQGIPGLDGLPGEECESLIPGPQGIQGLIGPVGPMGIAIDGEDGIEGIVVGNYQGALFTQGSVIFAGPGGLFAQDNANFFWDDANNRLGIGTTSPNARLHVSAGVTNYDPSLTTHDTCAIDLESAEVELAIGVATASPYAYWLQSRSGGGTWTLSLNPLGGNIGIGTAAPSCVLDVNGAARIRTLGAFAAGDLYVIADANGNLHLSATGPAS